MRVTLQAELAVGCFDSVAGDAKARGEVADLGDEGAGGYAARRYLVADLPVDLPVCGSTRTAVDTDVNVCDLVHVPFSLWHKGAWTSVRVWEMSPGC